MPRRSAETFKARVEELVGYSASQTMPGPKLVEWLDGLKAKFKTKLANVDLIEAADGETGAPATIGELLAEYQAMRSSLGNRSKLNLGQAVKSFNRYFGETKKLRTFVPADGLRYRDWALSKGRKSKPDPSENDKPTKSGLAEATVRKFCQIGRQVFVYAIKRRAFRGENPFSGIPTAAVGNSDRQHFVSQEVTQKVIEEAPNAEWRAIIALSRFGGLRVPSEFTNLRWGDIDFMNRRLTVRSPKTGARICPIFAELMPYLEELASTVQPGIETPLSALVIPSCGDASKNLRTRFQRILERAGVVKQWPRLFHNLRASRETELLGQYPARDVVEWLGNSEATAMKHYAMASSSSFEKAAGLDKNGGSTGGSKMCSTGGSITRHHGDTISDQDTKKPLKLSEFQGSVMVADNSFEVIQYPLGESNPCYRTENPGSWATRRRGRDLFQGVQGRCGGSRYLGSDVNGMEFSVKGERKGLA